MKPSARKRPDQSKFECPTTSKIFCSMGKYGVMPTTADPSCRVMEQVRVSQNVAIIHRAKVMPSGVHLFGPEPESNNRILRKYPGQHEYFLRVQFCDEDGQPVRFNPRISNDRIYHGRFKEVLEHGINIAGRVYKFLGFSHSSLRGE
jgi:hypothetical protein